MMNYLEETSKAIRNGVKQIVDITSAASAPETTSDTSGGLVSQLFDSALSSDFNSPEESNAKKVVAAALLIAKNKGILPTVMSENLGGVEAASIADESISRQKVGYQTAIGNIDVYQGADILIDKATARALAVSELVVDKAVGVALDRVSTIVVNVYPPLAPVALAVKAAQPFITEKVKTLVNKGITKLNKVAKTLVRKVGEKLTRKVSNSIKQLLTC